MRVCNPLRDRMALVTTPLTALVSVTVALSTQDGVPEDDGNVNSNTELALLSYVLHIMQY